MAAPAENNDQVCVHRWKSHSTLGGSRKICHQAPNINRALDLAFSVIIGINENMNSRRKARVCVLHQPRLSRVQIQFVPHRLRKDSAVTVLPSPGMMTTLATLMTTCHSNFYCTRLLPQAKHRRNEAVRLASRDQTLL